MTLIELQEELSRCIKKLDDADLLNTENVNAIYKNIELIAKVSKQMINNADVILRADKLSNRNDRIDIITGESC